MMSSRSSAGLTSSSFVRRPSPPGHTTTSYPCSLRIQVNVLTSDSSSSATRMRAPAVLAMRLSVLERRAVDVAAAHHQHRDSRRPHGAGEQGGRRGGTRRLDRELAGAPEKVHRIADAVILDQHDAAQPLPVLLQL